MKIIIDILMVLCILTEFSRVVTGGLIHEVIGIVLLILFILHNVLNREFYNNLFKGKYTAKRVYITIINILLLVSMLATIIFGIQISQSLFNFNASMNVVIIHKILGYMCMLLIGIHIGNHLNLKINKKLEIAIDLMFFIFGIYFIIKSNYFLKLIGNVGFSTTESVIQNIFVVLFFAVIGKHLKQIIK